MTRFLITTAEERTWVTDQPILFLGEWCKQFSKRQEWENIDNEIVPYHWDDRKKLQNDYLFLQDLHEELLKELALELNRQHNVDHSLRYWRILLGPWLMYFVEIVFDRWEMIKRAEADFEIVGVNIIESEQDKITPGNMSQFNNILTSDTWNEALFGELIKNYTSITYNIIPGKYSANPGEESDFNYLRFLRNKLFHLATKISSFLINDNEAFLVSTYLPLSQELLLQIRLKQFPGIWETIPAPGSIYDSEKRKWKLGNNEHNNFGSIIRDLIPKHLPTLYLEGYLNLVDVIQNLKWPKNPKFIFTSNSFFSDDVFKAWAAHKVENGSLLIIGQHGGNYGTCPISPLEEHEYSIGDLWLSWGWSDYNRPKIRPLFNFKMLKLNYSRDEGGAALIVCMLVPRYSYRMINFHISGQWLQYFNDQCRFVTSLPDHIKRKIIVRLQPQDYGWHQKQRWIEKFPNVSIDEGRTRINKLIRKSRIYISTYNATTFLESMVTNFPTLIFWDQRFYEISDMALPYYNRLKTVGIFHETPESAANMLEGIWDDIGAWWYSRQVQTVREEFCLHFSRMPMRPLEELSFVLSQASNLE
jgi:putative transferase (TIGR04331 family)